MEFVKLTKSQLLAEAKSLLEQAYACEDHDHIKAPCEVVLLPKIRKMTKSCVEQFAVVELDGAHRVIAARIVTSGIVNKTMVHPREVFRHAIIDNAVSIICLHNHPSGELNPSPEDIDITERLQKAGRVIGIEILDHVIVSRSGFHSMSECGEM